MKMVCPQCNGTFENQLTCPQCAVKLGVPTTQQPNSGALAGFAQSDAYRTVEPSLSDEEGPASALPGWLLFGLAAVAALAVAWLSWVKFGTH